MLADRVRGDAGRDRDEQLAGGDGRDLLEHRGQDLRLHRQNHHVHAADEERVVRKGVETVRPPELLEALEPHVGHEEVAGQDEPGLEEATDQSLSHVAAPEESDLLALRRHESTYRRGPRRPAPRPPQEGSCGGRVPAPEAQGASTPVAASPRNISNVSGPFISVGLALTRS
jgi:hypothetical protein